MEGKLAERFDLAITLDYKLDPKYSKLVSEREWVRGSPLTFSVNIVNVSTKTTPAITIVLQAIEIGVTWSFSQNIEIPPLEPQASFKSPENSFAPWVEGICKLALIAQETAENEIWITAPFAGTVRKQNENLFRVINRQQLDLIDLFSQFLKNQEKKITLKKKTNDNTKNST